MYRKSSEGDIKIIKGCYCAFILLSFELITRSMDCVCKTRKKNEAISILKGKDGDQIGP